MTVITSLIGSAFKRLRISETSVLGVFFLNLKLLLNSNKVYIYKNCKSLPLTDGI